jgi:hypothetical protein
MNTWDVIGYAASTLVLTAFGMKNIIPLRVVAMCSNLVFIIYGLGLELTPVWSLHAALLPMNAWRLVEALGPQAAGAHGVRQAADESMVWGSMISWLRSLARRRVFSAPSGNVSSPPARSQVRRAAAPPLLR